MAAGRRRYRNVQEMVRALSEDRDLAEGISRKIDERNIINHLMATRAVMGLSQKDIAGKMKCTQSRISKLESGKDDDLRIGDFHGYAEALGLQLMVLIAKKGKLPVSRRIKHHVSALKQLFAELSNLAGDDASMRRGGFNVMLTAVCTLSTGLTELLKDISQRVPETQIDGPAPIQIEVQQDDCEEVPKPACEAGHLQNLCPA